jgi:hypothetical protein
MKIIITESQFNDSMSNLLKKLNITVDIIYLNDNGRDSITATVYLYKNYEILGSRHGHEFFYKYDGRFNELISDGHFPDIERIDVFKFMPPEMVVNFFSDKVENYLKKFIDNGYSSLPVKRK